MSNKDMVAAWFKTSCSSPCAFTLLVLFQVYTAQLQNPSTVTVASFQLELDFCLTKQLQVLIYVGVSISPCLMSLDPRASVNVQARKD